jgi:hypothetical protein
MKIMILSLGAAVSVGTALAHTSVVPHEHPHATSMLPDGLALLLAALLVGIGFIALRKFGKE